MAETVTVTQVRAMLDVLVTIAKLIEEARYIPSGELYAMLMGSMSYETYMMLIKKLQDMEVITVKNHMITWVGVKKQEV
jgi:hypothetical protein